MNKEIDNVVLLIPIHPKDYNYIYNFILDIHSKIDIYLIFSSNEDYSTFIYKDLIYEIIIPEDIINSKNFISSIITSKKYYGLKYLITSNYDYIIVCDAEIDFIRSNFTKENVTNKINNIFENKMLYAGRSNDSFSSFISFVNEKSTIIFKDPENYDKIKNITKDFTLFYWFSNLPVYKRDYLVDFFEKIDLNNDISYHCYDYIVFCNYLLIYHNFTILDHTDVLDYTDVIKKYNRHLGSLEIFNTTNMDSIKYLQNNKYGFSFVFHKFFKTNEEYLTNEGTFIIFHLDRD